MTTSISIEPKIAKRPINRVIDLYKVCSVCSTSKPITEFYFIKDRKLYHSHCNICRGKKAKQSRIVNTNKIRNSYIKYYYGITTEDYNKLFIEQNGRCKCCGIHQKDVLKRLCIDHCHTTKKIRGLLCQQCNTAIGFAKDNVVVLQNMIDYLNANQHI